jgi:DNA-binding beta-propeller fold protein YncE
MTVSVNSWTRNDRRPPARAGFRRGRFTLLFAALGAAGLTAADPAPLDRSPIDLVLAPDETWLVTANAGSGTVSLVRVADGMVLAERGAGKKPAGLALARAGRLALVSDALGGALRSFEVAGETLGSERTLDLPGEPHGIAVAPDDRTAYVALTALDAVAVIDLEAWAVSSRIAVGRWPRHLALSADGSRLAVGTSGDRGVSVVDTRERKLLWIDRFVGLNIGHLVLGPDGREVWFPWMVYRRQPITADNIRRGWVLASRVGRLRLDEQSRREAISLDPPGKAVADPWGLAISSDGRRVVIGSSGTHELIVLAVPGLPFLAEGGPDHIDPALLADPERFARIEVGGRPAGLRLAKDGRTAFVANALANAVQVVDLDGRRVARTLALGGPAEPSLARRGEAIFYDARRSLDQWYSCHSCHQDGGTNSVVMDTLNDGTRFTFKTVLPLFDAGRTGPWTWHGWQQDLGDSLRKSLTTTMLGPEPSEDDVAALAAFLETLARAPSPHGRRNGELDEAARRGQAVFDRAGCAKCHAPPLYTSERVVDVGLGSRGDRYEGFNPPSLLGVAQRVLLLHDGRVDSLEDLLRGPHGPPQVNGKPALPEEEIRDLAAFLRSL